MQMRDWVSGMIGIVVFCLGSLPLLNNFGVGPAWFKLALPIAILSYVVAAMGFYLLIDSFIEISNSNTVGWVSFLIAFVCLGIGMLPVLHGFGIGPDFFSLGQAAK